jgi:2-(3-amino-3-carboxypropyl)histidine synthase
MRILLQFPEGLKDKALKYAENLEKQGNEMFISASPTFGACDLALDEAKNIKADKLVHFGHAEFHKVDFDVEYVEYEVDARLNILEDSLKPLEGFNTIGVVTTVQHVHQLQGIKEFYEKNGKRVVIGKPYGFARHAGQILGCDVGSSTSIDGQVDVHLYFGGGFFHPLGALLSTTKPFLVIDPFAGKVEFVDKLREQYRKRSRGKVLAALKATRFGVMFSTKNGQQNMQLAKVLKQRIESEGLDAQILTANTFDFDSLNNMMEFDAFVNTACPRLAIDDTERVMKPLLSANELMEVLKIKKELKLAKVKTN